MSEKELPHPRQFGYIISILVNVALIYVANNVPEMERTLFNCGISAAYQHWSYRFRLAFLLWRVHGV